MVAKKVPAIVADAIVLWKGEPGAIPASADATFPLVQPSRGLTPRLPGNYGLHTWQFLVIQAHFNFSPGSVA